MSDTASGDEPVMHYRPADHLAPIGVFRRAWAKVVDGVVAELAVRGGTEPHPFADHERDGGRVVNVTAVPCSVGYVVDTHGNVAPPAVVTGNSVIDAPHMPAPGELAVLTRERTPEPAALATDERMIHPDEPEHDKPTSEPPHEG